MDGVKGVNLDEFREWTADNPVIAKLQEAARTLLGGALLVLVRKSDEVLEVHPSGTEEDLPEFCRLYRGSAEGRDCCHSCRVQMTFGACYRGSIQYSCHGGVIIIASPGPLSPEKGVRPVIASCAFARADREEGWKNFRDHARGLHIDLRRLRAAYERMPVLTDERRRIAFALVEVAAAATGGLATWQAGPDPLRAPQDSDEDGGDLEKWIENALYLAQSQSAPRPECSPAELLVERVKGMVVRDPSRPFTLKNIAKAGRVSPNYLSTIFHQGVGEPFSEFLLEQRIAHAKRLLRDLTINVGEVAKRSGFPDASYFTRCFRKRTGVTPSRWRSKV